MFQLVSVHTCRLTEWLGQGLTVVAEFQEWRRGPFNMLKLSFDDFFRYVILVISLDGAASNGAIKSSPYIFRSTVDFNVLRRSSMESLKVLAARSVVTRVTSEESLKKLEVPRSLLGDILVAQQDSWSRRKVISKASIPFDSRYKNGSAEKNSIMVNFKFDGLTKKVHRTILLLEENSLKMKNAESNKKNSLVTFGVMTMKSWKKCPYCKFSPTDQQKQFLHVFQTQRCKKKLEQFIYLTGKQSDLFRSRSR